MKTLLVVDDEPSITETTRFILEAEGYHVLTVNSGAAAMQLVARERPQVVLLDVMMPAVNGFDVCRAIRRDPSTANTYVIMLTASGQRTDELAAYEVGANAYLRKPFHDTEVLATIEAGFAGR